MSVEFDLCWERHGAIVVARLKGRLVGTSVNEWTDKIREKLDEGTSQFLFDFRNLESLSSEALGALLFFVKDVRDKGGDLKILNLPPFASEIFAATRLLRAFEIFNDESVALRAFPRERGRGASEHFEAKERK